MEYSIIPRADDWGVPMVTRTGHFQFSLVCKIDGEAVVTIHGFRVTSTLSRIIPPTSIGGKVGNSVIHLVEISRFYEDKLLNTFRKYMENHQSTLKYAKEIED